MKTIKTIDIETIRNLDKNNRCNENRGLSTGKQPRNN